MKSDHLSSASHKSSQILSDIHCGSSTVLDTISTYLEEGHPLDAFMLMQSSLSHNRGCSNSRALAIFMSALLTENNIHVGAHFYDVLCRCLVMNPTTDYEKALDHVDIMVTSIDAGLSHAWHLLSSVLSSLIQDKTMIDSDLRENHLLFLKFLIKLFAADAASKEEKPPAQSLLYRVLWNNQAFVSVARGPVDGLLRFLSMFISAKDIKSTLILLRLVKLVALLCHRIDNLQWALFSRQLGSTIYNGTLCDPLFLERIVHCLSPARLASAVCKNALDMMTGFRKRRTSTATSELQSLALQYCAIPSPRPLESTSGDRDAGLALDRKSLKCNKRNCRGETALHIACRRGDLPRVKQLLSEPGIDVGIRDNGDWTPLHEACFYGHTAIVEELLKHMRGLPPMDVAALIGAKGIGGITPLYDASVNGHVDVIRLLLRYGGTSLLQIPSDLGKLPVDVAPSPSVRLLMSEASAVDPTAGSLASNSSVQSVGAAFCRCISSTHASHGSAAFDDSSKCQCSPAGSLLGTCSFNGCCCFESGQSIEMVACYLNLLYRLITAHFDMHGIGGVIAGLAADCDGLAVLISFFDEHTRALASGRLLGSCPTSKIYVDTLMMKLRYLQNLLPKDMHAAS